MVPLPGGSTAMPLSVSQTSRLKFMYCVINLHIESPSPSTTVTVTLSFSTVKFTACVWSVFVHVPCSHMFSAAVNLNSHTPCWSWKSVGASRVMLTVTFMGDSSTVVFLVNQ